jgi:hypothetical protein
MTKRWLAAAWAAAALVGSPTVLAQATPVPLRWDAARLGNHRYTVRVDHPAPLVRATLPWRRRDAHPEQVALVVVGPDGQVVRNVVPLRIGQAEGELAFEAARAGVYAIYYQPYLTSGPANYPRVAYARPADTSDPQWRRRSGVDDPRKLAAAPQAAVLGYEAVDDFDAYTDMERPATPDELARLLAAHAGAPWLLFPETRAHPVRMFDAIPGRWAQRGPGGTLADHALRGEYLSFQVGLWAARAPAADVQARFSDLEGPGGARIPAAALTCFNLGGIDYAGRPFAARLDVAQGRVQPLWMGLAVPADAVPGVYRGTLTIGTGDGRTQQVPLAISVDAATATAHGDDDPSRLTRLRWLDSTLAQDDSLVAPFTAVSAHGAELGILGRELRLAPSGLPAQIASRFDERMTSLAAKAQPLLAAPVRLLVEDAGGPHALAASGLPQVERDGPGKVHWQTAGRPAPCAASCARAWRWTARSTTPSRSPPSAPPTCATSAWRSRCAARWPATSSASAAPATLPRTTTTGAGTCSTTRTAPGSARSTRGWRSTCATSTTGARSTPTSTTSSRCVCPPPGTTAAKAASASRARAAATWPRPSAARGTWRPARPCATTWCCGSPRSSRSGRPSTSPSATSTSTPTSTRSRPRAPTW